MMNLYSIPFAVFFILVVLATAYADQCQIVLLNRCLTAYQEDLKATAESIKDHCFREQKIVTCIANEPKCGGELIEKFRYWTLQMAMMDKMLGTCPEMDYTALKRVVEQTDVGKTHSYLDDVEYGTHDACALEVHKKCVRYYLSLLTKDHKMCEDAEKLNKCYDLYSRSIDCKAKIIQRYANMVENVAHRVVELVLDHMKSLCNRAAEL